MRKRENPTYRCWIDMHRRCSKPTCSAWPNYGGRGIRVCERWSGADGLSNFVIDMGEKPDGLTLDRINNEGPYAPENCRWSTRRAQRINQRPRKIDASVLSEILASVSAGEPQVSVARRLGLHKMTVNDIVTNRWRPFVGVTS